ncbi:putative PEP-CTERM system TPR-repeat lipoprotein [alpha proteobacterium Q-1]|nr:putative PEP-CTERM system TPR-repeat lipoprotein [alpha proteobacterium Q-1]
MNRGLLKLALWLMLLLSALMAGGCASQSARMDRDEGVRAGIDDMNAPRLKRLGDRFQKAGDLQSALQFYRQAQLKAPNDPDIDTALGEIFLAIGERERARTALEQALLKKPDHEAATLALAGLLIGDGQFDRSEKLILKLHDAGRDSARSYNLLAVSLDLKAQHDAARLAYAEGLLRAPDDADILSNLALSMALSGEYAAARDLLQATDRPEANSRVVDENLALIAAMEGRPDEAQRLAVKALNAEQARRNAPFYARLGDLSGRALASAVFLGQLPYDDGAKEAASPEIDRSETDRSEIDSPEINGSAEVKLDPPKKPVPIAPEKKPEPAPASVKPAKTTSEAVPEYHLQLGTFSSLERVEKAWSLVNALPTLAGFKPYYAEGRFKDLKTVWRLLTGPVKGYSAGKAICAELHEQSAECTVMPFVENLKPLEVTENIGLQP